MPASQYQGRIIILAALMGRLSYPITRHELPLTFADFVRNADRMLRSEKPGDPWLIADIGATNARCAVFQAGDNKTTHLQVFENRRYASLQELLLNYVDGVESPPRQAALALAAPIVGNSVQMINCDWQFERDALAAELNLRQLTLVNDYHAVARALPHFPDEALAEVGDADKYTAGNRAVLGPGSGLGMAAWIADEHHGAAMTGEGGHITLAPRNASEDTIIRSFRDRYGHCSAERVLSGPGIIDLHRAMHGIEVATSEEISSNQVDPDCVATMNQFFSFLGSAAADLALISGAFGGLFIGGGIVPACLAQIRNSPFRERFDDKNRYRDYMRSIPTYVITDPVPGLTGLVAMIRGER